MSHIVALVLIILLSGVFGGITNYLRLKYPAKDFFKCIITGVAASALVPLLFKMMSSDLLNSSATNNLEYFTIAGFCLTAAIFSSKFIDSIGEKVFNQINKIDERVEKVEAELQDVTTETEIENSPETILEIDITTLEKSVLDAMYRSKFKYRSVSGLAAETSLQKDEVIKLLDALTSKGFIEKSNRSANRFRWILTEKGREYIASRYGDEES